MRAHFSKPTRQTQRIANLGGSLLRTGECLLKWNWAKVEKDQLVANLMELLSDWFLIVGNSARYLAGSWRVSQHYGQKECTAVLDFTLARPYRECATIGTSSGAQTNQLQIHLHPNSSPFWWFELQQVLNKQSHWHLISYSHWQASENIVPDKVYHIIWPRHMSCISIKHYFPSVYIYLRTTSLSLMCKTYL